MPFNLNRYLLGLSMAIDCVENELLGATSNHGRRVALVAMRLARAMGMNDAQVFDCAALAILHDNGLAQENLTRPDQQRDRLLQVEDMPAHCEIGETNVSRFPFQGDTFETILLHHENWDGSGFFGVEGEAIPWMAQVIALADYTDLKLNLGEARPGKREQVLKFLQARRGLHFSPALVELFTEISAPTSFWLDLRDPFLDVALNRTMPELAIEADWQEILEISRVFSRIIDSKSRFTHSHSSGLEEKTARMAGYLGADPTTILQLRIAAALHDVGKLAMPNAILDKPGKLDDAERARMMEHTYFTRKCLEGIPGLEQITEWASNHHEKLNGAGYPLRLPGEELDIWSRLLTVLDIYQALTEERPYRQSLTHRQTMEILYRLVAEGEVDPGLVKAVDRAFA
ncbi:3'3'-cGAMP-specific phosphodiesterase 1 [Candidatus Magnetaquicoccaceae bacterium FCR-1]|uniref:3'3'-cGAMP-specific phosphodiesterase 1 n=1 Tax=Candidatus Magnetaquiglobus chichijimensis TaxID=3141448 RepID=A0ABQ0CBA1_9PROT